MGIVIHNIIIIEVWRVNLTFPKLPNHTPLYENPITVTPLLMTSLSSQSLIPTLQIQRIQHLQASLHLFLYYCQLNAPYLTLPPSPPTPPQPLIPGPSRQIRKKCTSVWSSLVGAGSIAWLRPERLRTVALSENIQLFRERLSEKMCTRQSRRVMWDMINTLFLTL